MDALRHELDEVLSRAFGVDGQQKRSKVAELGLELRRAWDKGGPARRSLEYFAKLVGM